MGSIFSVCCLKNENNAPISPHSFNPPLRHMDSMRRIISFKDFKGFKKIDDISQYYTFFKTLGSGSFGEVKKAEHVKASVDCAVKIIKKKKIAEHKILTDLMHNELNVLEETVSEFSLIINHI